MILKLQIAESNRRFAMHDSEHSPSSTNSIQRSAINSESPEPKKNMQDQHTAGRIRRMAPNTAALPKAIRMSLTTTRQKGRSCKTYAGVPSAEEDHFNRSPPK